MKQTRLKENNNENSNEKTMVYSLSGLTESPPPLRCRILLLNNGESEELALADSEPIDWFTSDESG